DANKPGNMSPVANDGRLVINGVRPVIRPATDGRREIHLLITMTQTIYVPLSDSQTQNPEMNDIVFPMRGGCSLILDPLEGRVKYSIYKRVESKLRMKRVRTDLNNQIQKIGLEEALQRGLVNRKSSEQEKYLVEPFAIAHREGNFHAVY
ncbi:MAG TPA: hypothetical protein VMM56_15750, partial [Planctomycetaceae bacterium]|nr:hypothetical protein [Planctomycetaceae bacterium]